MSRELLYIFFIPVYAGRRLSFRFSRQIAPCRSAIRQQNKNKKVTVGASAPYTVYHKMINRYPTAFNPLEAS